MWIVLVFAAFVAIGLRPGTTTMTDTAAASGIVLVVLAYVALTRHLL